MHYTDKTIDDLLNHFKAAIGKDYDKYRNHVYRVFLNCLMIDPQPEHKEKYAIAAVFHDIGIWTDHTIDYLAPSIAQLHHYLSESKQQSFAEEITLMIYWHHKISLYNGSYNHTVETFRKADWIDVSLGLLHFGYSSGKIRMNRKALPNLGFHLFLIRKIIRNLFIHPLKPLPMFKT